MFSGRLNTKVAFPSFKAESLQWSILETLQSIARKISLSSSLHSSELNLIRSNSIGLMVPTLTNAFNSEIMRGIENIAVKSGFSLFVCPTYQSPDKETQLINDLVQKKTGGLIVLSTPALKNKELKRICSSMRVVSIQSDVKGVDNIDVTDELGMFEATRHLLDLGHRRIAFITYDTNISALNNRLNGFRASHKEFNVPTDDSIIFREHVTSSGYITAKALLQSKNPPTAIQCVNDHLAIGVYLAASDLSFKIPQQLSVSGFDNTFMSSLMIPNLTTVSQPTIEMGETAAALIIKQIIGDEHSESKTIILPTKHIIRDSTANACK